MVPIYKPYMPQNLSSDINEILYSGQLGYGKYGKYYGYGKRYGYGYGYGEQSGKEE